MTPRTPRRAAALALTASAAAAALVLPASPASANAKLIPVTALVSATPAGAAGNDASNQSDVSSNGRYVAFTSNATDLVPGDTNARSDVFVRDTLAATTIRVSVGDGGVQGDGASDQASISRDGRFVAFRSSAKNLVSGDTNGEADVFVRDLRYGTTTRVSVPNGPNGQAQGGASAHPAISADGHTVAFESLAPNLVGTDANIDWDVFVRDTTANTTELASVTSDEVSLVDGGTQPAVSGNGRYVTFTSGTNVIGPFKDIVQDVFLRDRSLGTTERVSLASNAATQPNGSSSAGSVSDDGRYVAFKSLASNLTPAADADGGMDVFVRDRTAATTTLVSRTPANAAAGGTDPSISADGTKIAFASSAADLVAGDTNGLGDVFVRDQGAGTTTRWTVGSSGEQLSTGGAFGTLGPEGTTLSFATTAKTPYGTDTNGNVDVFVRTSYQIGPFAGSADLVQRIAKDFTGSTLNGAAATAANNKLAFGTATPASMVNAYAHGTFDDHRGPVVRLYWAFFKRAPDLNGLNYWTAKHAKGTSIKTIANGFAQSSEFKTNFGYGTNSEFITLVYQNVLERNPDPAGLAHWVAKMKAGTSRGEMMTNFSESAEGIRRMRGEVDTVLVILGMLHRMPSSGEVISYANALELQGGQVTEVLVNAVLTGAEFASTVN